MVELKGVSFEGTFFIFTFLSQIKNDGKKQMTKRKDPSSMNEVKCSWALLVWNALDRVEGCNPHPRRAPSFDNAVVKSHTGLLLTKVTKPSILKTRKVVAQMGRISMPQGKGSQLHNRRDYEKIGREIPDNIDTTRTHLNVTLVDREVKEAYQEIFGEALQKFNDKQKRADRKIEDYYDHISKSKNGEKLFYEDVLQWGKKEDFENNPQLKEKAKECLEEYARSFQERNPNLKVIGAYIHMDEASPHLHLDYVPIAHGYKRGLETRNSLDKAMKEMGYIPEKESKQNNATKLWKEAEREYFGNVCRSKGLEVEAERKSRGSLSVEEYKEARDNMMSELINEKELVENELAAKSKALDQQANELQKVGEISALMASKGSKEVEAFEYTIPEKKGFMGRIEAPAEQGVFVKGLDEEEVHSLFKRNNFNDNLEELYNDVKRQAEEEALKKEILEKEIAELNLAKNELAPKILSLRSKENELSESIEQLENGWTEEIDNYILVEHKGLNELKKEYKEQFEKLSNIKKDINKKMDIATQDFKPEEVKQLLNDSMVSSLVQEAMMQTCKQLEDKGLLRTSYNMAFIELDKKKVIDNLRERVEDFIDNVKEHMQELAERVVHRHRGR